MCVLILGAGSASAQSEAICLYSDEAGTQCNFVDTGSLVVVYIYHQNSAGTTGSRFKLDVEGVSWIHLGDQFLFPTVIGSSVAGVEVDYNSCLTSPIHVGTANFFGSNAPPDAIIRIVAHPAFGGIKGVDCNTNDITIEGGQAYVNVSSPQPCVCGEGPTEPLLYVFPLTVDLGETETNGEFTIANNGGGTLEWTVSESASWLDVAPTAGTGDGTIAVTVDRTGLPAGNHSALVSVSSNGGNETVTVTMVVPLDPLLAVSPASLDFGPYTGNQMLHISNAGGGHLSWNIQSDQLWITAIPPIGDNDLDVTVSVDRTGLTPGPYSGNLLVSSNGGDLWVPVSMEVPVPEPVLAVSPASLSFGGTDTDLTLNISNAGTGDLDWNVSSDQPWLSVVPATGINNQAVTVSVDRTGLGDGYYQGNLSVTSNGGGATVPVDMWVGGVPVLSVNPLTMFYSEHVTTNTFEIANTGGGTLEWSLSENTAWIEIVPPLSGTGSATVTVNVDPALVPGGPVQTGYVTVNSNGGTSLVATRYERPAVVIAGAIAIYSDEGGTNCAFVDNGSLVQVHFFHLNTNGATASQWKLDLGGLPWTHLGDTFNFATIIGTSVNGVSIGYGGCYIAPIHLGVANFFGSTAPACSPIRIVADPLALSGEIEGVDCVANKMFPTGGSGIVNPDPSCWCTIPVQHTTWGAIKAMYQPD
jgi:hypothetical protein